MANLLYIVLTNYVIITFFNLYLINYKIIKLFDYNQ